MSLAKTAFALITLALVAACSTQPRMTTAERLDFYRSHSGEPVRSFSTQGRLWGWRPIGDGALTVWTRRDQGYLLELVNRCPEMAFTSSIGLSSRIGRVSAGFDSVLIPRGGAAGRPVSCRINTIRPVNTRVVKESKRDLMDLDLIESDPAATDEPQ
jgi:hypothetical protein